ncbi:MmgE/PrpD family protein [Aminobacter aminovorans]|uniref:2-methylcitrate dehydratase PrpD n=1 Tax=Aminobacter aminovorans TaxID=83263 RepID=A0AAC9FEQ6_AMIAI|nr:MmgE/PrpD family protein [Aminobacter aminovorans]AMS45298.1 MmgE/PrpD family protein [Aminobacter aminovorans]MBB3704937.1 2-methylcitrate dehydratase PrpD [Aminobacter aminovorans]
MDDTAITDILARQVAASTFDGLPPEIRHEVKRSILNFFGTAISGSDAPALAVFLSTLPHSPTVGPATIIGRSLRSDVLAASFLNAASANVADFDDTHVPTVIHPTAPIAPPLFALAEQRQMSGAEFILAFVLGVEVACRIGNAISPHHYRKGWHITATCGVIGAAAAASVAMRLDHIQTRHALAIAATQASGLVECLGTGAKSVCIGNASRGGLWSAMLAQAGLDGPYRALEGDNGYLAVLGNGAQGQSIVSGWGNNWQLAQNAYKPYPTGVVVNPVIDACLELYRRHGTKPRDIGLVTVHGNPLLLLRADRPEPRSASDAQLSAQHAAAIGLSFGEMPLWLFSEAGLRDQDIAALRRKVRLHADPNLDVEAARVVIKTVSGTEYEQVTTAARGGTANPLSDGELEEKFQHLTQDRLSKEAKRTMVKHIWEMEELDDIAGLLALATPT